MFGAILGDIVGSRFEFDNCKSKKFQLFDQRCTFTDDTVMTLAVAEALLSCKDEENFSEFQRKLVETMHRLGRRHPDCGYGGRFLTWLVDDLTEPYGSYGNGSAMRVSPVAWAAASLKECEDLAAASAAVTHNHPEGIKGAVAVAGAVYLARTGHTMEEIRQYAGQYYTLDFTLDEIRPDYAFHETCQGSVPQALEAFFESSGFEDAVRNAISIGGDSDTIAAITGSIAEGYYGIERKLKETALSYLDYDLMEIAEEFEERFMWR